MDAVFVPAQLNDLSVDVTLTSAARGDVLYRGASKWQNLAAGTSGYFLQTLGTGADPVWAAAGGGSGVSLAPAASSTNVIQPTGDAVVSLSLKWHSATHSGDLIEGLDNSGNPLFSIDKLGNYAIKANVSGQPGALSISGDGAYLHWDLMGTHYWTLYSNNTGDPDLRWKDEVNGRTQVIMHPATVGNAYSIFLDRVLIYAGTGQSADLQSWCDNTGTPITRIDKSAYFVTAKNAAPADGDLAAGEMALWLDKTNSACKLMVKAKETGGTVRTGSLSLS